jgi:hypothetical protein
VGDLHRRKAVQARNSLKREFDAVCGFEHAKRADADSLELKANGHARGNVTEFVDQKNQQQGEKIEQKVQYWVLIGGAFEYTVKRRTDRLEEFGCERVAVTQYQEGWNE